MLDLAKLQGWAFQKLVNANLYLIKMFSLLIRLVWLEISQTKNLWANNRNRKP